MAYTFAQALIDWQLNQQRRRRPLSPATIASYGDAWHSFMHWAHANQRHDVADITATDVADWLNTLTRHADGSVLTYSHGALAICRFLADRKLLSCDVSLIAMHASDARPRTTPSRAPDVADLRRLVSFYDHELPAGPIQSKAERMRLSQLRNAALLHLLFSTASRISEVLALDTSDLKGDHGMLANRVSVIGKGDKRRSSTCSYCTRTLLVSTAGIVSTCNGTLYFAWAPRCWPPPQPDCSVGYCHTRCADTR
jgi:site-specific recombinase XerD